MSFSKLKKRIKKNEGFSIKPYRDQLGFLTIGYGHLILNNEKFLTNKKTTKKNLEKLFNKDFNKALKDLKNFLDPVSKNKKDTELLIEMIFQIGIVGVLKFKHLLNNMSKKNKYLVCFEMMNSLWYKQTPKRVKSLIREYLKNEKR